MTVPPLPPRPQPPGPIRGMFPTDTTGASPWLPPEHRLTLAQRVALGVAKQLNTLGMPTRINGAIVGKVELYITGTDRQITRPGTAGALDGGVVVAMLIDTMILELTPIGITVTAEVVADAATIVLDTIGKAPQ